jgi:exopolysaccharide biosynthesis polyprenyl glycosylphosphotransferase
MSPLSNNRSGASFAAIAVVDAACVTFVYVAAVRLGDFVAPFAQNFEDHLPYVAIFLTIWLARSFDKELIHPYQSGEGLADFAFLVTKAVADSLVLTIVAAALFLDSSIVGRFQVLFAIGALFTLLGARIIARMGLWSLRSRGHRNRRVLIVGANGRTAHLVDVFTSRKRFGCEIVGYLENDESRGHILDEFEIPYLGGIEKLEELLAEGELDEVYVSLPIRSCYEDIQNIAHLCEGEGMPVRLIADLFPLRIATNRIMYIEDIPLLSLSSIPEEQALMAVKRAIDVAVSSILLVGLSWLFLLIALIIRLDSAGPILFAQERIGQNQRRFKMLKFRSMVMNAEELRDELEVLNEADGPVFKIKKDPRITRVGGFLRSSSLDELPQLVNVWLGRMSLVGPRPPLAGEVEKYSWDQRRRLSVKPGMTGLWQVSGRSNVSFEEWVEMDLAYIDTWTLGLDFSILMKTFGAVIEKRGAS